LALKRSNCSVLAMAELLHWSMLVFAVRADAELAKIASAARAPIMGYVARLMPILSSFTKQARAGPRSHPRRLGRWLLAGKQRRLINRAAGQSSSGYLV